MSASMSDPNMILALIKALGQQNGNQQQSGVTPQGGTSGQGNAQQQYSLLGNLIHGQSGLGNGIVGKLWNGSGNSAGNGTGTGGASNSALSSLIGSGGLSNIGNSTALFGGNGPIFGSGSVPATPLQTSTQASGGTSALSSLLANGGGAAGAQNAAGAAGGMSGLASLLGSSGGSSGVLSGLLSLL